MAQPSAITRGQRSAEQRHPRNSPPLQHYCNTTAQRGRSDHAELEASGAIDDVRPNFWSFRHMVLAICFQVVVTVAVPIVCACTQMRCAFLRVIVFTTLTMAIVT